MKEANDTVSLIRIANSVLMKNKIGVLVCIFLIVISAGFQTAGPIGLKIAVDALANSDKKTALISTCAYVLAIWLNRAALAGLTLRFDLLWRPIRAFLYDTIYSEIFARRVTVGAGVGETQQLISNGMAGLRAIYSSVIFGIMLTATQALGIIVTLLIMQNYSFMLIFIIFSFCYSAVFRLGIPRQKLAHEKASESDVRTSGVAADLLLGQETIKSYGAQEIACKILSENISASHGLWDTFSIIENKNKHILMAMFSAFLFICLNSIVILQESNNYSVGEFVLLNAYLFQIMIPIERLSVSYREILLGESRLKRLAASIWTKRSQAPPRRATAGLDRGAVSFDVDDLWFRYAANEHIIRGASLYLKPGIRAALVGRSGSGKSTLWRTMCGLYEAERGEILINGVAIGDIDPKWLKRAIISVGQDDILFNTSIQNNISLWNNDIDVDEILDIVNLRDIVNKLPEGIQADVGEKGKKLSGGERQRVALARAIAHNPRILILDESTSALDAASEAYILDKIRTHLPETTQIVISHRLRAIKEFDVIFVVEKGEIIEFGTHTYLMSIGGIYESMWLSQV